MVSFMTTLPGWSGPSLALFVAVSAFAAPAPAQNATTAGTATSPYPTIENLSIVWPVTGDANNDGRVTVRYRVAPAGTWHEGLQLFRVPAGVNDDDTVNPTYSSWANKHAGSIFDLAPGTRYDLELTLTDPDGGGAVQTLSATTRPVPEAAASSTVVDVTPATLAQAVTNAQPGQILLLGAGTYPSFTLETSGTSAEPLVVRGVSATSVVIDGDAGLDNLEWVHLENVTVQGTVGLTGGRNMVVRGCVVHASGNGIDAGYGGRIPENNYIADNEVYGPCTFTNAQLSVTGCNAGEGILITGPGNVVCHNFVKGFRDNLTHMEADEGYDQQSNDFCNNDLVDATDDAIEADSSLGNVRVMRNRITNAFDGISSQPGLGGPTYMIRNVMYNVLYSPFKLHNGTVGDVILHNTVVKNGDAFMCAAGAPVGRLTTRNNLFIGGSGGGTYGCCSNGTGRVLQNPFVDGASSLDYDGFGATGISGFTGVLGATSFSNLAQLRSSTTEQHAQQVDLGVFAASVVHPENAFPSPEYAPPDLRLSPTGGAVDKGTILLNVNDGYAGSAPDLGAHEAGAALPVYGPRVSGCGTGADCVAPPACRTATGASCVGGECSYPADLGASCEDGDGCTAGDACDASARCVGGPNTCTCSSGATRACYSGPSGTLGVGSCHGGTETCTAGSYGPCAGQATPVAEQCGDGVDNDCDGKTDGADDGSCPSTGPLGAATGGCGCAGAGGGVPLVHALGALALAIAARVRRVRRGLQRSPPLRGTAGVATRLANPG